MTITISKALPARQRGMSIVELMIAVTIGLIITLAISTLFLNTNRSNKENSDQAAMQENARFAVETIAEDLRHAGFFGNTNNPSEIAANGITLTASDDCHSTAAGTSFMLDFGSGQKLINYSGDLTSSDVTSLLAPCTATGTLPASGNSVLIIKRVQTNKILFSALDTTTKAPLQAGHLYVHSNGGSAMLGMGTATPIANAGTQIWEYSPRIYYISNNGTLNRSTFGSGWVTEPIADGIEQFRVEFGIDSDATKDGAPNYFVDAATDATFDNVVSARVHILARTLKADPNYTDHNSYTLGSLTGYTPPTSLANYHRQVYSTTVTIPNMRIHILPK